MANQQASVRLTAINPTNILLQQRQLHLSPSRRTIHIGRASKSPNKCLVAAGDNAWFDSPVMSRNHAEIKLHSDNKTLHLQDIGSMHGTVLNDETLKLNEPRSLNDGDVVKFGAEVRRGSETFPACSFKVAFEFTPCKVPALMGTTIKVPDSSDLEDEVIDSEDDNMSDFAGSSIEDVREVISIDSPASKRSESVEILEGFSGPRGLTEGQALEDMNNMKKPSPSGNAENPLVLDSDDDPETDEEMEEEMGAEMDVEMSDHSDHSDHSDDQRSSRSNSIDSHRSNSLDSIGSGIHTPSAPLSLSDLDSESESESEAEAEAEAEAGEIPEVIVEEVRRLSDNKGIEISNVRTSGSSSYELWGEISEAEDASDDSDSDGDLESIAPQKVSIWAGRSLVLSDVESESGDDSEDSDSSDDNDSLESVMGEGNGLSYQGSESGSQAVEEAEADASSDEDSDMGIPASSDNVSKYEIMKKALASDNDQETTPQTTSTPPTTLPPLPWIAPWGSDECESRMKTGKSAAQPISSVVPLPSDISNAETSEKASFGREPSPSDAAMVKEDNAPSAINVSTPSFELPKLPEAQHSLSRPGFNKWMNPYPAEPVDFAQTMGVKTGKTEFFKAREENKAHVSSQASFEAGRKKYSPVLPMAAEPSSSVPRPSYTWPQQPAQQPLFSLSRISPDMNRRSVPQFEMEQHRQPTMEQHRQRVHQQQAQQQAQSQAQQAQYERNLQQQQQRFEQLRRQEEARRAQAQASPFLATCSADTPMTAHDFTSNSPAAIRNRNLARRQGLADMRSSENSIPNPVSDLKDAASPRTFFLNTSTLPSYNETLNKAVAEQPRNVSIADLLAQSPLVPVESKKRKADDISEVSKAESISTPKDESKESADSQVDQVVASVSPETIPAPIQAAPAPPTIPEEPVARAPKRMKRFAEAVGYAALGGAAVGAGLFTALVATAPNFL